jgi:hypothetical protein
MTKEEITLLAGLLEKFFNEHDLRATNALNKNPIGSLLKKQLSEIGYWKNQTRGKYQK